MFNKLISNLPFIIEQEIMELALKGTNQYNINEMLKHNVYKKFLLDVNAQSANTIKIDDYQLEILDTYTDPQATRYRVPDSLLRGRVLVDVLYSAAGYTNATSTNDTSLTSGFEAMISNTLGSIAGYHSHECEIISDNEFVVYGTTGNTVELVVSYGETLRELGNRAVDELATGFTLLTKAWLRTRLNVKLNQGAIFHGHELSIVRDIISDYSSAMEDYLEFKNTVMGVVLTTDNHNMMDSVLTAMVGNNN